MADSGPHPIRLADYRPPDYLVDSVDLRFELGEAGTRVLARLEMRAGAATTAPLRLDGQELELLSLRLDGEPLAADAWQIDADGLTIARVPLRFNLEIETLIHPENNTALEGLYRSGGMFCTQCEAEGFRRITYYPDRPDVMAVYTTTIVADARRYPVLLANGNRTDSGKLDDGRHWARWQDPFPKPSYLFALVAGNLHRHAETFTTASGRQVDLQLFVEHHHAGRTAHAMRSLRRAMAWDEEAYGLEYDLDTYMIVAVDDFNMGAMENKGLNIFNTVCVLSDEETSTDQDFETVEAVIGHEYFHNWTGNRVTCRDWFQLSLKEGLTVFREHQFCSDMGSPDVHRIGEVRLLRASQFPEDAGPLAHPVRPDSYVEISNFYTPTIYQKGAEVIRMYQTLLGDAGYRRGIELYFSRHDGQAVTCDDFRAAMADANARELDQFGLWYSHAGTPVISVRDRHDPTTGTYTLAISQQCPPTPGQPEKPPMHIPLSMGLLGQDGRDLPVTLAGEAQAGPLTRTLELRDAEHVFHFTGLRQAPVPSLFRGFSAPVRLHYAWTDAQLALLLAHDSDGFTRWEAGQQLAVNVMLRALSTTDRMRPPGELLNAARTVLERAPMDPAFAGEALMLPSEHYLGEQMDVMDVEGIHRVRQELKAAMAESLEESLHATYEANAALGAFSVTADAVGRRALRNVCLGYLATTADGVRLAMEQYRQSDNMTDRLAALGLLCHTDAAERAEALDDFHDTWRDEPLVMNKWFRVQALSSRQDTPERIRELLEHEAFEIRNPNRIRALVGAFAQNNQLRFHRVDGAGYTLLADVVGELDGVNPQVAARIVLPLTQWRRQDVQRQQLMRAELVRIGNAPKLSKDVDEVVSRSLQS
ncbi:MAG: aminopeptidase N [Aquisalimonadaceae bacterium]